MNDNTENKEKVNLAEVLEYMAKLTLSFNELENNVKSIPSHENIRDLSASDVVRLYAAWRNLDGAAKTAKTTCGKTLANWNNNILPQRFEDEGIKTLTVENVGRVTIGNRMSVSMADKQGAMEWLSENGYGSLVTETVNSSTLAAFAKNLLVEEGKELPEEFFKVTPMQYGSLTKIK